MLSIPAQYVDSALLNVENQNYDSWQTIYFQRSTVIATELVLAYALHKYDRLPDYVRVEADMLPQIHPDFASISKADVTRHRAVNTFITGTAHYRPHSLPVQWLPIWHPHIVAGVCSETVNHAPQWTAFRRTTLPEAHIPVSRTRILRLPLAGILSQSEIDLLNPFWQCDQVSLRTCGYLWICCWTFLVLGPARSIIKQAFPILQRSLSRILGS